MNWYRITLIGSRVEDEERDRVIQKFLTLYMLALAPKDMALIAQGREIYLSPASMPYSQELIDQYHAVPSEKPTGNIVLLAGHRDILASLL
jgi:menaquinone-dependent protoporphyrinogen IX oxidase